MIVREVLPEEKTQFNQEVNHPLQSWEWGEFKEKTGKKAIRLGVFDPSTRASTELSRMSSGQVKLKAGYQLTVHPIPKTNFSVIYFPRGPKPDKAMLNALFKLGRQENAILIKIEPNVAAEVSKKAEVETNQKVREFLLKNGCREGRPFFFKYTFQIDLIKSEKEILTAMHQKTRYNIRLSQRHQVEVVEDNSDQAYETFIKLFFETTRRQKFYGQTPNYYRKMKEVLVPAGIQHLFLAKYKGQILATYIFFTFKDTLYYVYGGSSRVHRETMPTYALIWEAIRFGKKRGFKIFDLWAALKPNPDPKDPWYGFHRFKAGFGGKHIEFIGTYDLIINSRLYPLYSLANEIRWKFLKLKTRLPF